MIILGIDPGSASGAMAIIDTATGAAAVADIPIVGKGRVNSQAMAAWLNEECLPSVRVVGASDGIHHCFLENARTMPKQGISSSGCYMHAAGKIEAVIDMLEIPLTLVEANVWKAALKLRGKDKEAARLRAVQLYPKLGPALSRVKDHGRAEALLIAHWGAGQLALAGTPFRQAAE